MNNLLFDHAAAPLCRLDHGPLAGLRHRTVIDREAGSRQLALWQEEHEPGFVVPLHIHDCEEIITVLEGSIRVQLDERSHVVEPGRSILLHAWAPHGFEVIGARAVRLLAIFGSSDPRIFRLDGGESAPPWKGGASDHLAADLTARPPAASA